MNTYEEYVDSRLEWVGEIPKHWKMTVLKRLLSEPLKYGATEAGIQFEPDEPRYIRITDFDKDGFLRDDTFVTLPENLAKGYYVAEGDILLARSGATAGKTFLFSNYRGRACFAGYLIKASPARHRIKPEFLYYYTKSLAYETWKDFIFTQATIQNIGADKYAYLPVCVPPLLEQKRIAAYLDASCAAIDAAVAAKRRQLEVLESLWKATITRAVTCGLVPNIRTRSSGESWLGKIPEHWSSKCLKRLISAPLKYGLNEVAELEDRHLPRYIRITDFDDEGTLRHESFRSLPWDVAKEAMLQANDILFARSGATVGKTFMFRQHDGQACFAGYLIQARTIPWKLDPLFLYFYTKSLAYDAWKKQIFTQATIQNISAAKYNYLMIPVPPLDEQKAIISFITKQNDELNKLSTNIGQQIDALLAYRKSLIHECVTGKRRVTEADLAQVHKGELKIRGTDR